VGGDAGSSDADNNWKFINVYSAYILVYI
jgi:hypothetical protein